MRHSLFLALAAAMTLSSFGCGGPEGGLSGFVFAPLNANRTPDLGQARVQIAGSGLRRSAPVSPDGTFSISAPQGTYDVTVTHPWYPDARLGHHTVSAGRVTSGLQARFNDTHYLFIGINAYAHLGDLSGSVADAGALRAALVKGQSGSQNVLEPGSWLELTDAAATRQGIYEAIQAMLGEASPGDTLVVTYAGHGGSVVRNNDPGDPDHFLAFICPSDASYDVLSSYITEDDLKGWFAVRPDVRTLFVFDSCDSGAMVRSVIPPIQTRNLDLPGFFVLMGSEAGGLSYEDNFEGQTRGVFSYFLGLGLGHPHYADRDRNRGITAAELFEYARQNTVNHAYQSGYDQLPQFRSGESDLLLYRYN